MTDTAKNSAAAEEGVYETPEDIAAEAAKTAERAARADADSPIAPVDPFESGSLEIGRASCRERVSSPV